MPVVLDASIEGEKQVSRRLLTSAEGLNNWREPLQRISKELRHSFDANFNARGGLFGGWAPRKKRYSWPLLERTGAMRNAFRDEVHQDFVTIFNTAPYFKYHQSRRARTRLPRRVMMKIDAQRKVFIQKAFQEYINKVIRDSNRGGV